MLDIVQNYDAPPPPQIQTFWNWDNFVDGTPPWTDILKECLYWKDMFLFFILEGVMKLFIILTFLQFQNFNWEFLVVFFCTLGNFLQMFMFFS